MRCATSSVVRAQRNGRCHGRGPHVGSYEILAADGAGDMGKVYREKRPE
jgi:hypothetical protein